MRSAPNSALQRIAFQCVQRLKRRGKRGNFLAFKVFFSMRWVFFLNRLPSLHQIFLHWNVQKKTFKITFPMRWMGFFFFNRPPSLHQIFFIEMYKKNHLFCHNSTNIALIPYSFRLWTCSSEPHLPHKRSTHCISMRWDFNAFSA